MKGILQMASGLGAAFGTYRTVLLCMALAVAGGLHAGWVQPLFAGTDDPVLWGARWLALSGVLIAAFWWTARADEKVHMSAAMLMLSAVACITVYLASV